MKTKGLSNPIVAATAVSTALDSDQGKKAVGQAVNAAKYMLFAAGLYAALRFANKKFKAARADAFARENVGNPNLTAAAIINESFTRIGFGSGNLWSYLLPEFDISTDEAALYEIASKVTNIKAVSEAYKILFDRNLFEDTRNGLDTKELQKFWDIISSPDRNTNNNILFPIGSTLYCAAKTGITVNIAKKDASGNWKGTSTLLENYKFGEEVGEVVAHGVFVDPNGHKENYYIVKDCFLLWKFNCKTGVVLQHQVTNEKL